MNKVAIFGSRGYLGSQLTYYYRQKGMSCDEFDMPECDITSSAFWDSFDPTAYTAILFFAGLTGTEQGFADAVKFVTVNEVGLLNLLNKVAPLGERAPKIIYPSSRLVYRGAEHPLDEDDPKEAKTVYAANKLACESYLAAYANRYGVPYMVVRICVPYGNLIVRDYSYGTLGFFMKQAAQGKITLYGDGAQKRTFTHIVDICEIVYRLSCKEVTGTYNVGGSDLTLMDAAQIVAKQKGAAVVVTPWPEAALRLESGSTYFASNRLARAIGAIEYHVFSEFLGNPDVGG